MRKIFALLLVLFLGTAACENNQAVDGDEPGAGEDSGGTSGETPAPTLTFFADADGDGFGDPAGGVEAESAPEGFVGNDEDCNDGNAAVHPGAKDPAHDGIDQDCDGFFQWLPAEAESDGFFSTWAVDETAQESDNEIRVGDASGALFLGRSIQYDSSGRVTRVEVLSDRFPGTTQFLDYIYDDAGHVVEFVGGSYTDPA
ncbi:MAG TPA: putative metal-binding motif-containing protein, partial [bacterium]|nr:putative metal-binding motif-containing protein [bacterium]